MVPMLVVTGPTGVGKTSVAGAAADLLAERGIGNVFIDMDTLRWCFPRPPGDPFNIELGLRNLAAVWANCYAAGARRLVLTDIVEERALIARYAEAVPGAHITVVRLRAPIPTIHNRLGRRERGAALDWHRARAIELQQQWERAPVEDLLVETEGRSVDDLARELLVRMDWLQDSTE